MFIQAYTSSMGFFLSITASRIKKTAFLFNSHLHRKSRICYKALPDKQVKFLHLGAENIPLFLRQKCKHVSQGPLVDNDQTLLKYMLWFNTNIVLCFLTFLYSSVLKQDLNNGKN